MEQNHHHQNPEIWFRSSPTVSFEALSKLIETESIVATPRLGKRDEAHPKGYVPGTKATLRLFDDNQQEKLRKQVHITKVVSKPLRDFPDWQSVQKDISFFEDRPVALDEIVSLVAFSYLNHKG